MREKQKYNLSLVFLPQDNGSYTVLCPELSECFSEGHTVEEAQENIMDLIPFYLNKAIEDDDDDIFRSGLTARGKIFREIELEA